jgi:hypothetical protein
LKEVDSSQSANCRGERPVIFAACSALKAPVNTSSDIASSVQATVDHHGNCARTIVAMRKQIKENGSIQLEYYYFITLNKSVSEASVGTGSERHSYLGRDLPI